MFNKFKNIKIIGTIIIVLCVALFLAFNVKIKSVNQVNSERQKLINKTEGTEATTGVSQSTAEGGGITKQSQQTQGGSQQTQGGTQAAQGGSQQLQDGTQAAQGDTQVAQGTSQQSQKGTQVAQGGSQNPQGDTQATQEVTQQTEQAQSTSQQSKGTEQRTQGTEQQTQGAGQQTQGTTEATLPSNKLVTCTIEIRCDAAVKKKSSISNPGIKELIPDDGIILSIVSYTGVEGYTVYEVLADSTLQNNIAIVSNIDKSYVSSINGLSEKMIGRYSGWTYRVNGEMVMLPANKCKVKDNDTIVWSYVVSD